jgi:hypothetical protein
LRCIERWGPSSLASFTAQGKAFGRTADAVPELSPFESPEDGIF